MSDRPDAAVLTAIAAAIDAAESNGRPVDSVAIATAAHADPVVVRAFIRWLAGERARDAAADMAGQSAIVLITTREFIALPSEPDKDISMADQRSKTNANLPAVTGDAAKVASTRVMSSVAATAATVRAAGAGSGEPAKAKPGRKRGPEAIAAVPIQSALDALVAAEREHQPIAAAVAALEAAVSDYARGYRARAESAKRAAAIYG